MNQQHLTLLQNMPIFGGIREEILQVILDASEIIDTKEGTFFFKENEKGDFMSVIQEGKVAVVKEWQGKLHVISHLNAGDCFGEMEILDLENRSASILAMKNCKTIKISTTTLYKVYKADPKQYSMILINMGREVSRRLRLTNELLFQTQAEAATLSRKES